MSMCDWCIQYDRGSVAARGWGARGQGGTGGGRGERCVGWGRRQRRKGEGRGEWGGRGWRLRGKTRSSASASPQKNGVQDQKTRGELLSALWRHNEQAGTGTGLGK